MKFLRSKKNKWALVCLLLLLTATAAFAMSGKPQTYSWRYKMTVVVETPEGIKTGSAVRKMSNAEPRIDLPDVGNPADVRGEAVVVDLGERGVLYALISHQSDHEFYNAFPTRGPSTLVGIKHYASLPLGTNGVLNPELFPSYPKLVTFANIEDPKSVTLAQVWERDKQGYYHLKEDRMETLFGKGVKLKDITLEITDEPVTRGVVEKYLPEYNEEFRTWFKTLKYGDPRRITEANFK